MPRSAKLLKPEEPLDYGDSEWQSSLSAQERLVLLVESTRVVPPESTFIKREIRSHEIAQQISRYEVDDLTGDKALLNELTLLREMHPYQSTVNRNWAFSAATFIIKYRVDDPEHFSAVIKTIERISRNFPNDPFIRTALTSARLQLKKLRKTINFDEDVESIIDRLSEREDYEARKNLWNQAHSFDDLPVTKDTLSLFLLEMNRGVRKAMAKLSDNLVQYFSLFAGDIYPFRLEGPEPQLLALKEEFENLDASKTISFVYGLFRRIVYFLAKGGEIEEESLSKNEQEFLDAFLEARNVPENERAALIKKIEIEIARVTRPKWLGREERGGKLATLSAPQFLKQVHADYIAEDGTVENDVIRTIDPDLMKAVEIYISSRRARARKNNTPFTLGDAEGLKFVLVRPGASAQGGAQEAPSL